MICDAILATGFVADAPDQNSLFPSAGGGSADPRVQAVYWRCIAVFFTSARINNPSLELAFFSNVEPPTIDGVDLAALMDRLEVTRSILPLTRRLPAGKAMSWGNVFYFMDIFAHVALYRAHGRLILTDSDMVIAAPLDAMLDELDRADFGAYRLDTPDDADINGMSRSMMAAAISKDASAPAHLGGEFFAATLDGWREYSIRFEALFEDAVRGSGPGAAIRTEEHLYSIVLSECGSRLVLANPWMKRIWTSPRHSTVAPGDEALPIWHLPAEKRYGLQDLFFDLSASGFPEDLDPSAFRALAMKRCGLPRKSARKIAHDGIRQVAAKLGLRL